MWWPEVDADAEKLCNSRHGCQAVSKYSAPEPMAQANPPSGPWQNCAVDILGSLPSGENLLVKAVYYSRYFEVVILRSTTSTQVIDNLEPIFTRFGVPHTLKTDNGPQFISEEFRVFLAENGIEHRTSPPLWPQANGKLESYPGSPNWRKGYSNDNWCSTILLNVWVRNVVEVARVETWGAHHQ